MDRIVGGKYLFTALHNFLNRIVLNSSSNNEKTQLGMNTKQCLLLFLHVIHSLRYKFETKAKKSNSNSTQPSTNTTNEIHYLMAEEDKFLMLTASYRRIEKGLFRTLHDSAYV